jgi:hypothetical protein
MIKQLHKKFLLVVLAALFSLTSQSVIAYEVSGENFPANFKITSWTAEDGKSTITSEGVVGEGYGKVYLTHTFNVNSDDGMSGDMVGQARTVNQDGELQFASLQGVWSRDGKIVSIHSFDSLNNGVLNHAQGRVDLFEGTLSFKVFPVN